LKKLKESVKRRYLQSFRIAVFDGHPSQGSASNGTFWLAPLKKKWYHKKINNLIIILAGRDQEVR
jgi:hypothetical protein